jgi:adenylate cyclase
MKNRVWLLQIPVVLILAAAFWVTQQGVEGDLSNTFVRERLFPRLRGYSSIFLDWKFRVRGPQVPKNNIVIVEVDSPALAEFGRWPWHRDKMAALLDNLLELKAKAVGFDIVFSERDQIVSSDFLTELNDPRASDLHHKKYDGDTQFTKMLADSSDGPTKVVLGWTLEGLCQPGLDSAEKCQLDDPDRAKQLAKLEQDGGRLSGLAKHAIPPKWIHGASIDFKKTPLQTGVMPSSVKPNSPARFDFKKTPLLTGVMPITNLGEFQFVATSAGYFDAHPDPDAVIRRGVLLKAFEGRLYPALPLEMARAALDEELEIQTGPGSKITSLRFRKSGASIPITSLASTLINFRGPKRTFKYVSISTVLDAMSLDQSVTTETFRGPASESLRDIFKDAYVLVGVSALGVFDMRAFPFDSNVPGTEGHATILDNLLSNDFLSIGGIRQETYAMIMLLTMLVMGIAFAMATERLESIPALLLGVVVFSGLWFVDFKLLFSRNIQWDFSFLYAELGTIFVFTTTIKYVLEERNKKFIKGAFSKYVAPTIVDSILKDPTKLSVGGERRELSILFSDIRGFTTMSEKMQPKQLATFLNDYLGIMTDVVFDTHGTLDKYIGDAVMAFWGAPIGQADHAYNACEAARIMMRKLGENRARFQEQYGVVVDIGIGINSGTVIVGNMGSERIFEYTVIGDDVNLASRLEGLTKEYHASILTTRFTMELLAKTGKPLPPHRTIDFVKVKGKNDAVELLQIFEVERDPEGVRLFDEARKLYSQRRWDEASALFTKADEKLRGDQAEDGACRMYIERCEAFRANPPEDGWDGSWKMTTK